MKTIAKQEVQDAEEVCNCPNCTYDREVQTQLSKLKPAQRQFFLDMYVAYCDTRYTLDEVLEAQADNDEDDDEEDFGDLSDQTSPIVYH